MGQEIKGWARRAFLLPAFLALAAMPAFAQPIETVVVTAKPPQPVGQDAFSVVTLDAKDLSISHQLDDSLEQVPGLSLYRRSTSLNSNPTTQGVSLREIAPSGASRALVLLDGVPVNDPFGGWVIWSALPPEDIGSADVVRGAGSGPYGSGALTGTIALSERGDTDGLATADASAGSLGTYRAAGSGGTEIGNVDFFGSAADERSNGWIPVDAAQRGAADNHLSFDSGSASLRAQTSFNDIFASARIGVYDVAQGAGLEGAQAESKGITGSLTLAKPATVADVGWRTQFWIVNSDLMNSSVSVAPDRSFTTPANDQYSIPALGYGGNAALLGTLGDLKWEVGGDARIDSGESQEHYLYSGTDFLNNRRAGGRENIGGLYAEGALTKGPWFYTANLRADAWSTAQGHLVESVIDSGLVTNQQEYPGRDGVIPSGRLGIRRNFDDGEYLRVAAYTGFRLPTLNELYRPFRVGNDVTEANAALSPEQLYGTEVGWGGEWGATTWDADVFYNALHNPVGNVTIGVSTSGGAERQRQNIPDINAVGFEADIEHHLTDDFSLRGAVSLTDARVDGGLKAPQLTGKRPALAPLATITGGAAWRVLDKLTLSADLRWESNRFEDDLNTLRQGSAFVLDARADWRFADAWSAFVAVDNAFDADVVTAVSQDDIFSYGQPRVVSIGIAYTP
ncbi:MAG TPA: TonB-dependent receptor [Rhizomicrobium sp.]|nr:TonB-dependent receptor [Rhizomicrobium sp.]